MLTLKKNSPQNGRIGCFGMYIEPSFEGSLELNLKVEIQKLTFKKTVSGYKTNCLSKLTKDQFNSTITASGLYLKHFESKKTLITLGKLFVHGQSFYLSTDRCEIEARTEEIVFRILGNDWYLVPLQQDKNNYVETKIQPQLTHKVLIDPSLRKTTEHCTPNIFYETPWIPINKDWVTEYEKFPFVQ